MEKINEAKINPLINTNIKLIYAKLFLVIISFALLFIGGAKSAGAATLYFSPASGSYIVGDTFSVSIFVSSAEQAINAASGVISFSQEKLEIISLARGDSIFNLWVVEPAFSNCAGTINFEGIGLNPGFVGLGGKIISINFKAKAAGSAALIFSSGSVLANDGHGTNILANMGDGSYTISAKAASHETAKKLIAQEAKPSPAVNNEEEKEKTEKNKETEKAAVINKPEISSLTHPDQTVWYNNNEIEFKWELPYGTTGVSILLNDWLFSDPGPLSDGLFSNKSYQDIKDGVWYLHLKLGDEDGWSEISNFKVQIDTLPPQLFKIEVKQEDILSWPALYFKTADSASGIDRYEVKINGREFTVKPEDAFLKVPVLPPGEYTAIVKAVDKANNETLAIANFTITPIQAPIIENYSQELESSNQLFISGIALPDVAVNIFIQDEKRDKIIIQSRQSDKNGNWHLLYQDRLKSGRYFAWAESVNSQGRKSESGNKINFLITPPLFARVGLWLVNYFVVLIIVIIAVLSYLAGLMRNKLKKETNEAQTALHKSLRNLRKLIEKEIFHLDKIEGRDGHSRERSKMKKTLKGRADFIEKKVAKEIKDIENLLPDFDFDDKISKLKRIIKK